MINKSDRVQTTDTCWRFACVLVFELFIGWHIDLCSFINALRLPKNRISKNLNTWTPTGWLQDGDAGTYLKRDFLHQLITVSKMIWSPFYRVKRTTESPKMNFEYVSISYNTMKRAITQPPIEHEYFGPKKVLHSYLRVGNNGNLDLKHNFGQSLKMRYSGV